MQLSIFGLYLQGRCKSQMDRIVASMISLEESFKFYLEALTVAFDMVSVIFLYTKVTGSLGPNLLCLGTISTINYVQD